MAYGVLRALAPACAMGAVIGLAEFVWEGPDPAALAYTVSLDTVFSGAVAVLAGTLLCLTVAVARPRNRGAWVHSGALAMSGGVTLALVAAYFINRDLMRAELDTSASMVLNAGILAVAAGLILLAWQAMYKREANAAAPTPSRSIVGATRAGVLVFASAFAVFAFHWDWSRLVQRPATAHPLPGSKRPPVVMILIDTARADHLSVYGYERDTTPTLVAFADDGIVFENAFSSSPWTVPSVASLFTGLYPTTHATTGMFDKLPHEAETIAELLRNHGYETAAFLGTIIANPNFGFGQGFGHIYPKPASPWFHRSRTAVENLYYRITRDYDYFRGDQLNRHARKWLDMMEPQTPFFIYMHYMEPHAPYDPPSEHLEVVTPRHVEPLHMHPSTDKDRRKDDPSLRAGLLASYDGEIRYVDELIGNFLQDLKRRGLYEDSLIVVVADHGEEFNEHGRWGHNKALYQETLHIPFLVKLPNSTRSGIREEMIVELVDVKPTIEEVVDIGSSAIGQGQSVLGLIGAGAGGVAFGFKATGEICVRTPDYTLIESPNGQGELFDRVSDADELEPLSSRGGGTSVRPLLHDWFVATTSLAIRKEAAPVTEKRIRDLRSLGYIN